MFQNFDSYTQAKLEVMGKKAKNATFISGNEATKISREIEKVEKRRIVKSTNCNERSSRSHCMVCFMEKCILFLFCFLNCRNDSNPTMHLWVLCCSNILSFLFT